MTEVENYVSDKIINTVLRITKMRIFSFLVVQALD